MVGTGQTVLLNRLALRLQHDLLHIGVAAPCKPIAGRSSHGKSPSVALSGCRTGRPEATAQRANIWNNSTTDPVELYDSEGVLVSKHE
jgi:hypothetical protein